MNRFEAQRQVEEAERGLYAARAGLREALEQRDAALHRAGWNRLIGGFRPDAQALYTRPDAADPYTLEHVLQIEAAR